MGVSFTPQQQEAINALGSNVLVSASAGAGKTAVLIGRLMKRITIDRVSLNDIVAMTFTEAAASEMKTRLLDALTQELNAHPEDPFLQTQCQLVETANISTIHSFCLRLIKDHGYILGIDPKRATNILDQAQTTQYQDMAFQSVYLTWAETQEHELIQLLDHFSLNPLSTEHFKQAIFKIMQWLLTKQEPHAAYQEMRSLYTVQTFDAFPDSYQQYFFDSYQGLVTAILTTLTTMRHESTMDTEDEKDAKKAQIAFETLTEVMGQFEEIQSRLDQKDIAFYDLLPQLMQFKTPALTFNPTYTYLRTDVLVSQLNTLMSYYEPMDQALERLSLSVPTLDLLYQFATEVQHAYDEIKTENQCFDFDDFEHFALKLLNENDGAIAKQFQNQLQEIMVDEFQDTNDFQDAIITAISNGHNIFRVGDVKQSIYGFRGAKPSIMQSYQKDPNILNLNISSNFRSKSTIVDLNNELFEQLLNLTMHSKFQESDYVTPGTPAQKENTVPVALHVIEPQDGMGKNQLKARHIANEIVRLHTQEHVPFKDIMILIRNHGSKTYLKEAFEAAQIPHYIPLKEGFFQSDIIQSMIAMIQYHLNHHEYDLVNLLMSPFFGYTKDDLADIKGVQDTSFTEAARLAIPDAMNQLDQLFNAWKHMDVVSIIESLFAFKNCYHRLDLQSQTNCDHLLSIVSSKSFVSLASFMDYLDIVEEDTSTEEASFKKDDDDVVTTMTIHQSKGLQFPVVFVWGLPKHAVKDHTSKLICDDDLGFNMSLVNLETDTVFETMHRLVITEKQHHEAIEESLRLLYVALTRAQHRMILVEVGQETVYPLTPSLLRHHKTNTDLIRASELNASLLRVKMIDAVALEIQILPRMQELSETPYPLSLSQPTPAEVHFDYASELNLSSHQGTTYGTLMHDALEILPNRAWTSDDLHTIPQRFHQDLLTFNAQPFTQTLYEYEKSVKEYPFIFDGEVGIIDWFLENDDTYIMVDYKTDNASLEDIVARYQDQMQHYKTFLEFKFPDKPLVQYIYSMKHHTYIKLS